VRRLWARLRWGPPCGAEPPAKLPDAGPCLLPRRRHGVPDEGWHADGNGYIWNDELGRWRWMGPVVDLGSERG
jgi:hypothetical protein